MSQMKADNRIRAIGPSPAHWMIRSNLVNQVLEIVGDIWILQILAVLMGAPHRFDQIVAAINVPRSTLASRLRRLMAAKCVTKQETAGAGVSDGGGYCLTEKGSDLLPVLKLIRQWNEKWRVSGHVLRGRPLVNACGHAADVEIVCASCGRPAEARDMKVFQTSARPIEARLPRGKRRRTTDTFSENGDGIPAEVVLGDRWAGLIMATAFFGATKYSDIEAALGIAPNILAARLDRLTRQGLLSREQYQDNPPRHAYHLTEKGLSLYPIIVAMDAWARKWLKPHEDLGWRVMHKPCLEWFVPRVQCARCKSEVL
jgi:DNA-binding HxlR family transcriptional regulator